MDRAQGFRSYHSSIHPKVLITLPYNPWKDKIENSIHLFQQNKHVYTKKQRQKTRSKRRWLPEEWMGGDENRSKQKDNQRLSAVWERNLYQNDNWVGERAWIGTDIRIERNIVRDRRQTWKSSEEETMIRTAWSKRKGVVRRAKKHKWSLTIVSAGKLEIEEASMNRIRISFKPFFWWTGTRTMLDRHEF